MLFSHEWLQEYVDDLPSAQELLENLTHHSVEVEEVIEAGDIGNVVVAQVLENRQHPNADSLHIGLFDVGEEEPRQIIYGMKAELPVGSKLPVALAPTKITGGVKIKKSKLRGEVSQGMCCLNSELGILNRKEEVNFFDESVENGTPVVDLIPTQDTVIDIDNKSMTHRADLFSHANMAREIAAVFGKSSTLPEMSALPTGLPEVPVTIEDDTFCPRYMAARVKVNVAESPEFIQRRLTAAGIKVINNVVDITNYVMLEMGEPMHAFDAAHVADGRIMVRRATEGEAIVTLDKESKKLTPDTFLIADSEKPLAVAGVIGGMDSGVSESTTEIILEAANFEALSVRRAGQTIGVRTDSLLRWEKGVAPGFAEWGMARALDLLTEHASAEVVAFTDHNSAAEEQAEVVLEHTYLKRMSGMDYDHQEVVALLERLECEATVSGEGAEATYTVRPPFFRQDIRTPEDVVEEVVRLHGVKHIPMQQLEAPLEVSRIETDLPTVRQLRNLLPRYGAHELINYSFVGDELLKKAGLGDTAASHIRIANPLSADLAYLRASMFARMLENMGQNSKHQLPLTTFEIGHVYNEQRETRHLALMTANEMQPVRQLRGLVEQLLTDLGIAYKSRLVAQAQPDEAFNAPYAAGEYITYTVGASVVATLGEVSPQVSEEMDITVPVAYATIHIPQLTEARGSDAVIAPISSFPSVELDLAIVVDQHVAWSDIDAVVRKQAADLLQSLDVFDVYTGEGIPEGKKSIGFRITLQSQKKTLEMDAMERWRDNELMAALTKSFDATLRG